MRLMTILILTVSALDAQTVTLGSAVTTAGTPALISVTLTPGVDGVAGWSYGVAHDPTLDLLTVVSPLVLSVDVDYISTDIHAGGYTHAAVVSLGVPVTAFAGGVTTTATYSGAGVVRFSTLTLGSPVVENIVAGLAGVELAATWTDGSVSVNHLFQRGDCNGSGSVSITDAVVLVEALFVGGPAPECDDACDSNDDGVIDVSDVLYSLGYLFGQGAAPPPPFGVCGDELTADALGCAAGSVCP